MANFDGVNYAKTVAVPSVKISSGLVKGELWVAYDEYTTLANFTTADVIRTAIKIPAGAKVHFMAYTIPTNGGTIIVGIAGATSKYKAGLTAGTAMAAVLVDNNNSTEDAVQIGASVSATGTGLYSFALYFSKI